MARSRKTWSPVLIFLITLGVVLGLAVFWDALSRQGTRVMTGDTPRRVEDLDIAELKVRFDGIAVRENDYRPSNIERLQQRADLAALIVRKSPEGSRTAALERQMLALRDVYRTLRQSGLDFTPSRDQLFSVIESLEREASGEILDNTLLLDFQLACDLLMDGADVDRTLARIDGLVRRLAPLLSNPDLVRQLEHSLTVLTLRPDAGEETSRLLDVVSSALRDHPVPRLAEWSRKLADDAIFLRHGLFRKFDRIERGEYEAGEDLLGELPALLEQPVSDFGMFRILTVAETINPRMEAKAARSILTLILDAMQKRERSPGMTRNIENCQFALLRLDRLGQPVNLSQTDIDGKTLKIGDGTDIPDTALLVCVVDKPADFDRLFGSLLESALHTLRHMRLAVLAAGVSPETARAQYGKWSGPSVYLFADPDRSSPLFQACPTSRLPWVWLISRDHRLREFDIYPERLPEVVESLNYSRTP